VEFQIEDGISEEDVMSLLQQKPSLEPELDLDSASVPQWEEERSGNYQSLKLDYDYINIEHKDQNNDYENEIENDDSNDNTIDPFTANLMTYQEGNEGFRPVVVRRATLHQIKQSDIIIVHYPHPLTKKYYRNLMPDIQITKCQSCFKVVL